jgi:hypothetical protein
MRSKRERGVAMVAMLMTMAMLLGVGAAIHTGILAETSLRGAHGHATAGFYAAEAGINRGMGDYRNIFLSYGVPEGSDFDEHSFTLGGRTVKYQLVSAGTSTVTVPAGKPFAGLNAIEHRYTSTATSELKAGDVEASLGTEFDVDYIPLFQFLAFYDDDLEIEPGPNMNLHGPIHTNGTLYLNSEATLTIAELQPTIPTVHVTAGGDVFRGRKDRVECHGTVRVAKLVDSNTDGALDLLTMACSGAQSTAALSSWLGAIKAKQPVVAVPTPDIIQRGSGLYWEKADLRIVVDLTAPDLNGRFPIVVQDAAGNLDVTKNALLQAFMVARPGRIFYNDVPVAGKDVVAACTTANSYCHPDSYAPAFGSAAEVYRCGGTSLGLYGACTTVANQVLASGGVTARRGGFYNMREHAWVYMLNVNMHDLLEWNMLQPAGAQLFDPADDSDGGLVVFLSVAGGGGAGVPNPRRGVRVFGSPTLPFPSGLTDPTGLTLVSDGGIYLEGNYNAGTGLEPKQPAAAMGDTLNILSPDWSGNSATLNDYQSRQALASRPVTSANTIVNAAFIAGVDPTTTGNYNGGLENYPRFLESWSGRTLTYRGSFVSLGPPLVHDGPWCGTGNGPPGFCNIYNAPGRNWDYDTDFQQVQNLPPLTPRFVSVQQILFTENFR